MSKPCKKITESRTSFVIVCHTDFWYNKAMPEATKVAWSDGITGPTLDIARSEESPLRVLAGPGTGKSFALMRRVMRLLDSGVAPESILVSTFTRTAAKDLADELTKLAVPGSEDVKADTLHALCFGMLGKAEVLELTNRNPRPLMDFETRFLLQDLSCDEFGGIRECIKRLNAFNGAWARNQSDQPGWLKDKTDRAFDRALQKWLTLHRAMLIGEVIPVTLRYLRDNPACPERSQFGHVLVDEYQDLNRAEQVLLDTLASIGKLTVIGDENQSIYSFKYAHPEGIVKFKEFHGGTVDATLKECRRCPQAVVTLANELIGHSRNTPVRLLVPYAGNPKGEIHVVQWKDMDEEAEGIADFIKKRIRGGTVNAGRVLVLSPRRQFGYAIRDRLKATGVEAHSFFNEEELDGSPTVLTECVAQERFTLLCLLADPEDEVSLRCWCGFGHHELQQKVWGKIIEHCASTGAAPADALADLASGKLEISHSKLMVQRFVKLIELLAKLAPLRGAELVDALFPPQESWTEPFRSMAASVENPDYDAKELAGVMRSAIVQPELPTNVDYVRIMSLHKSKGLTADLVVVCGCTEGLIPGLNHKVSQTEQEALLEEQRRLFYVAITRTRNTLVLSSVRLLPSKVAYKMRAQCRRWRPDISLTIASRFLGDLGPARPAAVTGEQFAKANL